MTSARSACSAPAPRLPATFATAIVSKCAFAVVGIVAVVLLAGCPEKPAPAPKANSAATSQADIDEQCELIIGTVHDTFHLDRLALTTDLTDGVARLNDWTRVCGADSSQGSDLPGDIAARLTKEQLEYLQNPQFTVRDGVHLQDGVMLRAMARALNANRPAGGTELDHVVQAFQFVVRSIELTPEFPPELALSAYEICQLGKGTAADRAWVFASLLKQDRIDAVIVSPGDESPDGTKPAPFLVGVPVENQLYLFDPRLGVPVPPLPDGSGVATLEQAASDPAVLRQLDSPPDQTYPMKSSDLEHPSIAIITESGYWPERTRSLQGQFSGEHAMAISDPLQDIGEVPGLVSRIVAAGGTRWSRDSLKFWDYPEQQLARHLKLSEELRRLPLSEQMQTEKGKLFSPFYAYVTIVPDPKTGKLMIAEQEELADRSAGKFDPGVVMRKRTTVRAQLRARLKHLAGDTRQAVMDYQDVLQNSGRVLNAGPPVPIRIMHARAMDDSSYWTALCKFEQGDYQIAIDRCTDYRRKFALGAWRRQVRYLLAQSYAATGDRAAAIKELEGANPNDPEYAGYQLLIRQWKAAKAPLGDQARSTNEI